MNPSNDFRRLATEGHEQGVSKSIGMAFVVSRDRLARFLIRLHVTPNMLTLAGFFVTCGAAVCFLFGASQTHTEAFEQGRPPYSLIAAACLFFAFALDMLDGAVARLGEMKTPLGAVLDSSLDRFSDIALYLGILAHFAAKGNVTYAVLAAVAMADSMLISYIKARSENLIPDCSVGYWLRGERCAALLIAASAGTISTVLWQQALSPAFTVLRRLVWTHQVLTAQTASRPLPSNTPAPGWRGWLRPWRYPRGSVPYDVVTGANIAFIIFAHHLTSVLSSENDALRKLASTLLG